MTRPGIEPIGEKLKVKENKRETMNRIKMPSQEGIISLRVKESTNSWEY